MSLHYIAPQHVRAVWPKARILLEPAIARSNGRWQSDYVLAALVLNEQSLWVALDEEQEMIGAATVQICEYPEKRMLALHFLGGNDFDAWYPDLYKAMVEYGRKTGCDAIECNARYGFWKWFKHDGFRKTSQFYEKTL